MIAGSMAQAARAGRGWAGIVVAAGRGTRAGGGVPKQWRDLAGRPVVDHALAALGAAGADPLMLVIHPADRALAEPLAAAHGAALVEGGETRADSVRAALEALAARPAPPETVLIHDGARPLVSSRTVARLLDALAEGHAGAAPALAVTDALWRGVGHGEGERVAGVVDRSRLFRAQTPQAFAFAPLLAAHRSHGAGTADDVAAARAAGLDVVIVEGDEDNLKITHPGDFARAARLIGQAREARAMDIRMGTGFDVHAFGPGDHCWLCGVAVPHDRGLMGHSDADVGMHALTDALYGALAEGDIGRHFPPSDPQWKGAASEIFLAHAMGRVRARGYALANCDVTLICERPKIGPHAGAMQDRLAAIMGVEAGRISVKATTSEQLGFTGRGEGIAAMASALLVPA